MGAHFNSAHGRMAPLIDSPDPNLAAFKKHGGKLIQDHGWNEAAIPPRSSIHYYNGVAHTMGDTSGIYPLYLIPRTPHCTGRRRPRRLAWVALLRRLGTS